MTITHIYIFISVILVSLVSLVGIFFISLRDDFIKKYIFMFVSLAVGALLGDAFIHLIPGAFAASENTLLTSIFIISGVLIFFILEKFLHWHHHADDTEELHIHPVGKLVLLSDGIHNFIDGIIMGVSFLVSPAVGVATTIAVILHEIPQEIGDYAVLLHSGYTKKRALWLNFLSALLAILGAIVAIILGENGESFVNYFIPIAAGGFIYIAIADLMPELQKTKEVRYSILQISMLLIGVLTMMLLLFLE